MKKERCQLIKAELARITPKRRRSTTEMFSLAVTGIITVTEIRCLPPLRVPQLHSTAVPDTLRNPGWGNYQKTGNSSYCGKQRDYKVSSTEAHLPEDLLSKPDVVIGRALQRLEVHGGEKHLEEEVLDIKVATPLREYLDPEVYKLQALGEGPKSAATSHLAEPRDRFVALPGDGSGAARMLRTTTREEGR